MSFDPYYELLGIPAKDQPAHHYRLLGIDPFEENPSVIQRAADRQMVHVRSYQTGPHGVHSQRLLTDISVARLCLLDASKKAAYDAELRRRLAPTAPPAAPPPPPPRASRAAGSGVNLSGPSASGVGLASSGIGIAGSGLNLGGSGSDSNVLASDNGTNGAGSSKSGPRSGSGSNHPPLPPEPPPMSPWLLAVAVGGGVFVGGLALALVLLLQGPEPSPIAQKPPVAQGGKPTDPAVKPNDPAVKPKPVPKPKPVDPKPMSKPANDDPLPMIVIPPTPMDPGPNIPLPMLPVGPATPVGQDSGQIPGLVFYAPMDEGVGNHTLDQAGKTRGAFKGAPKWVDGKYGKALQFDGRAHVDFGRILPFEADKPFSIGCWVWIDGTATEAAIGGKMIPGTKRQRGYELAFNSAGGIDLTLNTNGTTEISGGQPGLGRGGWIHVMATYSGGRRPEDITFYLGGRPIGTRAGTTLPGSLDTNAIFCLGGRNGTYGFVGMIDEFRVYNRQLSDEEVGYLFDHDPADLSTSLTVHRVPVTLDEDGAATDVLPLIDPRLDNVAGEWTIGEKSSLVAPADGLFQLPVVPPLRYRLTLVGKRTTDAGSLTIGLPVAESAAAATFFGATPVSVGDLDGKAVDATSEIAATGEFVIICDCSPDGIQIKVNGEEAIAWEGSPKAIGLPSKWQPKSSRQLFLASTGGAFQISRVQLARPTKSAGGTLVELPLPPSDEELREPNATIRAEFQKSLRTARTPEARVAVAEEFIVKGKATSDAKIQYAMLTQARDTASAAGGAELALEAIDYLAKKYRLDAWEQRAKAMTDAARVPQTPLPRLMQLARQATELSWQAAQDDQFAAANKLLELAAGIAQKAKDNDTRLALQAQEAENDLRAKLVQDAAKARTALERDPTDGAARITLGRYYALAHDDWQRGAKELRQSGDAKLVALATAELGAFDGDTRRAAGEGWWRHAQTGNDPCKIMFERHALDLLCDALPGLPAAQQKEVNRFISQIFVQTPAATPKPIRRGLKVWLKADEGVQTQAGQAHTWVDSSGSGNNARQDKPQYAMKLVPNVLAGKPVLRSEEGTGQCFSLPIPEMPNFEGLTVVIVANTAAGDRNEVLLCVDGPDARWDFASWNNGLGHIRNNPLPFVNRKLVKIDEPFLMAFRFTRKLGWQVEFDGKDAGFVSDKTYPLSPPTVIIGNNVMNSTSGAPFGGDIAEILIYDHPLPPRDFREVSMYLGLKYQLSFPLPLERPLSASTP